MPTPARFELFQDESGEWGWELIVSDGGTIADSSEGYPSKQEAKRGIQTVKQRAPNAQVVDAE
ncbi:YegP family protein [Halomarina salina]|uniref:YegP family protein n=1 Tax=Halomarina salina TaxID=1872699 RepID=A0ABD5RSH3_9EURY|nr:DUF1508 domain-containing protein [Halomarina salina]